MIDLANNPSFYLLPPLARDSRLQGADLYLVKLPMAFSFKTAKTTLAERETLVVRVQSQDGSYGYGECVAFSRPFYTEETLEDSWKFLRQSLVPLLLGPHLGDNPLKAFHGLVDESRRYPMATAALENALLDLFGRQQGRNMVDMVFGERLQETIPMGLALGDIGLADVLSQIQTAVDQGCRRIKLKIKPADGLERLRTVRQAFPHIILAADANGSFAIHQWQDLAAFDELGLACLEEPFSRSDLAVYRDLRKSGQWHIQTPICLDESVLTLDALRGIYDDAAIDILNIKIGRLGGLYNTKAVIDFCRKHHIAFWIGSMVESAISKLLHVQLSALQGVYMAGDLSDSSRYFQEDFTYPDVCFSSGYMKLPTGPGLGAQVLQNRIDAYCTRHLHIEG